MSMLHFPFALTICADKPRSAVAIRALMRVTNLVHLDCTHTKRQNFDWIFGLKGTPLLVITGAHECASRDRLADHLDCAGVEFATVGVTRSRPLDFGAEFPLHDHDFLAVIHTPRARPQLRSPELITHTLRTANRLEPPDRVQIELPLRTLSFIRPSGRAPRLHADLIEEAAALGQLYCELFNRNLPASCAHCGVELFAGTKCPDCDAAPEVPRQTTRADELGCIAWSAPDEDCTAQFVCLGG